MEPPATTTSAPCASSVASSGHDEDHLVGDGARCGDARAGGACAPRLGELLAGAEALALARRDDDRGDAHGQGRTAASRSSAVGSSTFSAKVSSETRIWRARVSIRFSPAESPLSLSRIDRFRTTSATW